MDGNIDAAVQQCLFYLFYKQAFATHFGQGDIRDFIARGFDDNQLGGVVRVVLIDLRLDPSGLPQGQLAPA
jgi:hypothetical protein